MEKPLTYKASNFDLLILIGNSLTINALDLQSLHCHFNLLPELTELKCTDPNSGLLEVLF